MCNLWFRHSFDICLAFKLSGTVSTGEDEAQGRSYCPLQLPERRL